MWNQATWCKDMSNKAIPKKPGEIKLCDVKSGKLKQNDEKSAELKL